MSTLARKALVIFLIGTISQPAYPQKDIVTRDSDGNIEYRDSDGNFMENEAYEVSDDGMTSKYAYESPKAGNETKRESHSFEHSDEAGESGNSNGAGGNRGSNGFYEGVIKESRSTRNYAIQSAQIVDSTFQKNQMEFTSIASGTKHSDVETLYQSGESLISDETTQKISYLIGSLVTSNQATLFSSFSGQYENNKFNSVIYQQEALKNELRSLFPNIYSQNIQQIKQAQEILRNWTLVGQLMKNSGFDVSLMGAENAISNVQKAVDLTGLGPVDRKLMDAIDQFNEASFSRFADYISGYLASIPSPEYDVGPDQKKDAEKFIVEAFKSLSQNQDFLAAASSLLQAKEIFRYAEPPHESEFGPDDVFLMGVGSVVTSLGKGIERYGVKEVLTKVITIEQRSSLRRIISKQVNSGIIVIGRHPKYLQLADELNAHRFRSIPESILENMSKEELWEANKKFLDRAIRRGDRIRLATPIRDAPINSSYKEEINYFIDIGYKESSDGLWLVRN